MTKCFAYLSVIITFAFALLINQPPSAAADTAQSNLPVRIVPRVGPTASVASVAFSPDGARILSGGYDQKARLYDAVTGALLRSFAGHSGAVKSVAFSPGGKQILTGSEDKTAKLWNAVSGDLLRTFEGNSAAVYSVAFSPDGSQVLTAGGDKTVKLWDAANGQLLGTLTGHSALVYGAAFAHDGANVISGSSDQTVKVWDRATGNLIKSIEVKNTGGFSTLAISLNASQALIGSKITLLDLATGKKLIDLPDTGPSTFSPDGKYILSGGTDNKAVLRDSHTGEVIRVFDGHSEVVSPDGNPVTAVAFSADGTRVLAGCEDYSLELWDAATGKALRTFGNTASVATVVFSPDGSRAVSGSFDNTLRLWDSSTGRLLRTIVTGAQVNDAAFSPDGSQLLSGSNWSAAQLWDVATGRLLHHFGDESLAIAFSPDGKHAVVGGNNNVLKLWDAASGKLVRSFGEGSETSKVAFSRDGRRVVTAAGWPKLWDSRTGQLILAFEGDEIDDASNSVAISPDGSLVLAGGNENLRLWDTTTGKLLRRFEQNSTQVLAAAFSPDGKKILSGNYDSTVKLWDVATRALLHVFNGHTDSVYSVAFSPDGNRAISGSWDTTTKIWSVPDGKLLSSMVGTSSGEWIAMTPAGFFAASGKGADETLSVVRGFEVTTIGQVHQSLFNPDLVQEGLAGDPHGELKAASDVINLDKVVASGPPPNVEFTSGLKMADQPAADIVPVAVRISDRGSGIGRLEWRVNGITVGIKDAPPDVGTHWDVTQQIALDPGENAVEVVAYNKRNLLASLPAERSIKFTGAVDATKPKLHVLAVGINKYVDEGWVPPGRGKPVRFPPLRLAVSDAKSLADALRSAGKDLYSEVEVALVLDEQATVSNLDAIVSKMAAETSPRDTFIFFVAGHGYSKDGRFYLIPQDYQGGNNPNALATRAIGQSQLQDWIANRIKAKKALILLDTCESGALTNGYEHSRVTGPASEASMGRLHEATGRPVLTASAANQYAHEGEIGGSHEYHGVFTWAVLDALRNGDSNGDGVIELSELVAHVQTVVPGLAKGLARAVADTKPVFGIQTPRFASPNEDFALVRRL